MIADKVHCLPIRLIHPTAIFLYLVPAIEFHMKRRNGIFKVFPLGYTPSPKFTGHVPFGLCRFGIANINLFISWSFIFFFLLIFRYGCRFAFLSDFSGSIYGNFFFRYVLRHPGYTAIWCSNRVKRCLGNCNMSRRFFCYA